MSAILLNLQPGDEVIVPSFTFVSSALAFAMHGAKIVFCDVDETTLTAGVQQIEPLIGPRTRAVCVVHYGGISNNISQLAELCRQRGVVLIEDNAHGLFAHDENGKTLGTFGALATQSFHETKNISCGEGGALVINDESFSERAEIIREKGTDRSKFLRGATDKYTWVDAGSSYVLSDLLAAVLVGQLERLDEIQESRRDAYFRYQDELTDWSTAHDVKLPPVQPREHHPAHVFYVRLPSPTLQVPFLEHLKAQGVTGTFHYQPLHLSKYGKQFSTEPGQHPVTEDASATLVRLPLFESLTEDDQTVVIDAVKSFEFN